MPRTYDFDAGTVTSSLDFDIMADEDFAEMVATAISGKKLDALAAKLATAAKAQQMVSKALLSAYHIGQKGLSVILG